MAEENNSYINTKATIKKLGFNKDILRDIAKGNDGKPVHVMRVFGNVRVLEIGETDHGPWYKFHGGFELWNTISGETFDAKSFIAPCGSEVILQQIVSVNETTMGELTEYKRDKETKTVACKKEIEFVIDYFVAESKSATGYEYSLKNALPKDDNAVDRFAHLKKVAAPIPGKQEAIAA